MLYITASGEDYKFFREVEEKYEGIIVSDSKNFDGSKELVEVFIKLAPIAVPALTVILHEILSYMKAKYKADKGNSTEILVEKKTDEGEFKVLIKSSEIEDVDKELAKVMRQIKKL